jgi:recombination protein RecT
MNTQPETKPSQEVTTSDWRSKPLGVQLKEREGQFLAALPSQIPVERFIRVILTAIQNNPKLREADRDSLWNAAMRAAQDGLLPDGRDGALVIFNTKEGKDTNGRDLWIAKVQWMPMIGGLRKKVRNSGEIKDWNAQVVHAKDHFEFELGDTPFIKHKPYMDGDPGAVIAAYSIAQFKSGELSREVMTRAQIEKVRSVSRSKDKGPWVDWYDEMCRKTVARRHSKSLPMSSDLDDLIRRDDDLYDLEGKSDKSAAPRRTMTERLDLLAGNGDSADADPPAEPDAGAIIDNEHTTSPADTKIQQGEAAATDARVPVVENGAGSESRGGDPAPVPQDDDDTDRVNAEAIQKRQDDLRRRDAQRALTADNAFAPSGEGAAPMQRPQTGGDARAEILSQASPPATSRIPGSVPPASGSAVPPMGPRAGGEGLASPREPSPPATSTPGADEARKARIAEIKTQGEIEARKGQTALMNYNELLLERREVDLVSRIVRDSWREIAKAADAAKVRR